MTMALVDLGELPLERVAHLSLLGRPWQLRAEARSAFVVAGRSAPRGKARIDRR